MAIDNFTKRTKAERIYNIHFNPKSSTVVDFSLLDTLHYYGVITEKQSIDMEQSINNVGQNLYDSIKRFDKQQLKKLKK